MSIGSLTGVALARNSAGKTTKADSGELPKDAPDAQETASISALLAKQVPTGMVASYTAVTAAIVEIVALEPSSTDLMLPYRWAAFAVLVLGSLVLTYVSYRAKATRSARFPIAELVGVGTAAAGWGLVIPDSPLLAGADGRSGLALVAVVGFLATVVSTIVAKRLQASVPEET